MLFSTVARSFDTIQATSSRLEMTRLLADLFNEASSSEAAILCNVSLGQLNPPYVGTQFAIADKSMIKVLAELLGQDIKVVEKRAKELGDLGLVVAEHTWKKSGNLTVHEVYNMLHDIEQLEGTGSQEAKIDHLRNLLQQLDPLSAKYVVRIVIGKLRLGFSDMTLVDALSWMVAGDKSLRDAIENAYNVCADIGLIASTLKAEGIKAVEKMQVRVGIPIRPAAAERLPTAKAIIEKIGPCIAQPKLDGFRLQIHVDKTKKVPEIHFFSRNLQDMSAMFPDIKEAAAQLPVKELICEGEAIVYDVHTHTFLPFQETVKRKRKHNIEEVMSELPLRVFIFDVLYYNGQELMSKTTEQRRKVAVEIFKNFNHDALAIIEEKKVHTAQELEAYFTQSIAAGLEGLVVKKPDSIYQPGKRNFNWIKLKRQEEGQLEDTLDCVVLGYYAGEGKRTSFGIGAFLVGLYNKKEDRFETVAKIGTGLKDLDWLELKKRCDALAVARKPKNVVCPEELTPDVWVQPEIVVMVRADEITLSPMHAAGKTEEKLGYALRFPRFMGYRPDKTPTEATTVTELLRLYADQKKG